MKYLNFFLFFFLKNVSRNGMYVKHVIILNIKVVVIHPKMKII